MHDDRALIEERLSRALRQRIRPALYVRTAPLQVRAWHVDGEPVPASDALAAHADGKYESFEIGQPWGSPWSTTWFELTGQVPADWAGERVEVVMDLGFDGEGPGFQAEGMAYDADGVPIKGIAPLNAYVPVAEGVENVHLFIEAAANPSILHDFLPTEMGDRLTAPDAKLYRLVKAELAVRHEDVWQLIHDVEVLDEVMRQLPVTEPRRHLILRALDRALDALDLHDVPGTAAAAREQLADALASPANASAHHLSATGHAHIDSAWLWPLRETVRKASRTFANVTALAKDYPELVFSASQAQQYAWVKENQPHIYQRIQDAVKSGNWSPVGSMWVESDANLPGGEALARQLVVGKRFFAEEFGVDTQEIWLPDSFGYTAAFPQLARLAGVRWFLTQKLSWNQTNRLPHHTFWWEGIDGSRVFTHFPPVDTYNAVFSGEELSRAVSQYAEKGFGSTSLIPFGHGDGGGGPTRDHVERARRLANLEGAPRVTIEKPSAFFARAEAEYPDAPVWSGELYLEFHRGTYTSQHLTKAGNRRSEHLLREAELWATTAALQGKDYPYEKLEELWKTVLLHQFHDILPGSSIAWVHREARETYARVAGELETLIAGAFGDGEGDGIRVFNAGPQARSEVVAVPVELAHGVEADQKLADGRVAMWSQTPALGTGTAEPSLPGGVTPVSVTDRGLDNGLVRVRLDDNGNLQSVFDLEKGREALAPGTVGNLLQLHPDHPNQWDAWDIDKFYKHKHTDLSDVDSIEILDAGPLSGAIRVRRSFGESKISQVLRLTAGSQRLDIETEIDWHESEKVLKASFPIDVHADRAASEIQFGHVYRPTHANTSWDAARFEVYAHRWVHVAEPGYGVAIVNDATYGYDVGRSTRAGGGTTTTVRLTLLRAPKSPDPETDQGIHQFTYSIRAGAQIADAVSEGYSLNLPLRVAAGSSTDKPLVSVSGAGVMTEAVKLAEDRSGDVIVRFYESSGSRTTAAVSTGFDAASAKVVDLLERPLADAAGEVVDGELRVPLRPFEIVTVRLKAR
ncbi:glycoside hydrolase family 38 C-terminal domain-containing protein [Fodinicola feengrottensis]|uniref:Glycoside hydrolase family 38 C-terminal domain-containing protein n=1 Tax=Fodinicola feengrottensis TaxID=435914 RepID=A0ABN2HZV6_9ACTN